jgi:hypothetical protein
MARLYPEPNDGTCWQDTFEINASCGRRYFAGAIGSVVTSQGVRLNEERGDSRLYGTRADRRAEPTFSRSIVVVIQLSDWPISNVWVAKNASSACSEQEGSNLSRNPWVNSHL